MKKNKEKYDVNNVVEATILNRKFKADVHIAAHADDSDEYAIRIQMFASFRCICNDHRQIKHRDKQVWIKFEKSTLLTCTRI